MGRIFYIAVIVLRAALCLYRAAAQPISIDEAFSFNRFVGGPWSSIYSPFDANNHVLYSMLAKMSWWAFGVTEWSLRAPSVAAGIVTMILVAVLLQKLRAGIYGYAAFTGIALHPLLLDFSIAARGYSLSIALFLGAFLALLHARPIVAGSLLGLAAAANLSIAIPAVCAVLAGSRRTRFAVVTLLSACAVFVPITYSALSTATPESFYAGYPTLRDAVGSYVATSMRARMDTDGLFGAEPADWAILFGVLPLMLVFTAAATYRFVKDRTRALACATLWMTMPALVLAHHTLGVPYPPDRAILYAAILLPVAWAVAVQSIPDKAAQRLNLAVAIAFVAQFGSQLRVEYFQFWQDAGDQHAVALHLREQTAHCLDQSVTVTAESDYVPVLEYYRTQFPIRAIEPVDFSDPEILESAVVIRRKEQSKTVADAGFAIREIPGAPAVVMGTKGALCQR